jgi:hypothetical protein
MFLEHNMKIIERIYNVETGETVDIERDETAAETKARLDDAKKMAIEQTEADEKATARAVILDRLGLTAEEAAILLGGN